MKASYVSNKAELNQYSTENKLRNFLNSFNSKKTIINSRGSTPRISYQHSLKGDSPFHRETKFKKKLKMRSNPSSLQKQNTNLNKGSKGKISQSILHEMYKIKKKIKSPNNPRSNYLFIYQIGFGGFGKVWKVQEKNTKQCFAMKQIEKKKVIDKDSVDCIMNEKKILSKLEHPFLVNMNQAFQDQQNLYLVIDYLKGADLRYHICYKQNFTETQTSTSMFYSRVSDRLPYTSCLIIHRDIKPQNLILEENGYVRLTDFGIAKYEREVMLGPYDSSGTPGYMAPEILFRQEYNYTADYFAIGVVAYELMLGRRPYHGKNRKQIKQMLRQKDNRIAIQDLPQNWSMASLDFINNLIEKDPKKRLGHKKGIKQIKKHQWLADIDWRKLSKKEIKPPFVPYVICETKDYLDEINSYNELNEAQQKEKSHGRGDNAVHQQLFEEYYFQRMHKEKTKKDNKRGIAKLSLKNSCVRFL